MCLTKSVDRTIYDIFESSIKSESQESQDFSQLLKSNMLMDILENNRIGDALYDKFLTEGIFEANFMEYLKKQKLYEVAFDEINGPNYTEMFEAYKEFLKKRGDT